MAVASGNQLPPPPGSSGSSTASSDATEADSTFQLGEVYAYPNPAKPPYMPTLHIETGLADEVQIRIYDVSGGLVHEASLSDAPAVIDNKYAYEYRWDTSGVGSGVYIYAITTKKSGFPDIRASGKSAVIK